MLHNSGMKSLCEELKLCEVGCHWGSIGISVFDYIHNIDNDIHFLWLPSHVGHSIKIMLITLLKYLIIHSPPLHPSSLGLTRAIIRTVLTQ